MNLARFRQMKILRSRVTVLRNLCFLLILLVLSGCDSSSLPEGVHELHPTARISFEDQPSSSELSFDDSEWLEWPLHQPPPSEMFARANTSWYRIDLRDELLPTDAGLLFTYAIGAYEVSFDGQLAGKWGKIEPMLLEELGVPPVIAFPQGTLPKLLAVRMVDTYAGGLVQPQVLVGDLHALELYRERLLKREEHSAIIVLSLYAVMMLLTILTGFFGGYRRASGYLLIVIAAFSFWKLHDSPFAELLGLRGVWGYRTYMATGFPAMVAGYLFHSSFFKKPSALLERSSWATGALLFLLTLTSLDWLLKSGTWQWLMLAAAAYLFSYLFVLWQYRHRPEAKWFTVSLLTAVVVVLQDNFTSELPPFWARYSLDLLYLIWLLTLSAIGIGANWRRSKLIETVPRELEAMRDETRSGLARELHDGVAQELRLVQMRLAELEDGPSERKDEVIQHLGTALSELRGLAHGLREGVHVPLLQRLEQYVAILEERSAARVELTLGSRGIDRLTPEQAHQVFRIVQESTANAIQHAEASRISVTLSDRDDDSVQVEVSDDGQGFDVEGNQPGVGLSSITERAELMGAALKIQSDTEGTVVRLSVLPA